MGTYAFSGVVAGNYTVSASVGVVVLQSRAVTVFPELSVVADVAAPTGLGSLSGPVDLDQNNNGARESNEFGAAPARIPGISVFPWTRGLLIPA